MAIGTLVVGFLTAPSAVADRGAAPGAAVTPLRVLSQSAVYSPRTRVVVFSVRFNRRPNFHVLGPGGQLRDSFQYLILGDGTLPYPENFDAIVRGIEIKLNGAGGLLPIRRSGPPDPSAESGGWGSIRAVVPVRVHGSQLRFSAPLAVLSDHSTDGRVAYQLETYDSGAIVDHVDGESVVRDCSATAE